ncbi:MAG TPA: hypothetical protein PKY59_01180 [Pyrinomonadaceae bacterium]|nr:hypothetical protein [Pyrinomonadaceae bacterium]
MIWQDNDPHHIHPEFNYLYVFIVLAVILGAAVMFGAPRIMKFLDDRYERKKRDDDSKPGSQVNSPNGDEK